MNIYTKKGNTENPNILRTNNKGGCMPTIESLISDLDGKTNTRTIKAKLECLYLAEKIRSLELLNDSRASRQAILDLQLRELLNLLSNQYDFVCRTSDLKGIPEAVFARGMATNKIKLIPKGNDIIVLAHPDLKE